MIYDGPHPTSFRGFPAIFCHQTNRFRRFYGKNVVIYFVVKKNVLPLHHKMYLYEQIKANHYIFINQKSV